MKKEQLLVAYNNMQTCGFDNLNAAELWQYHKLHKELAGIQKDFSTDELALVEKYKIQYNPAIKQFFTTSENKDDLKTFTEVRGAALTEEIPVSVKPSLAGPQTKYWKFRDNYFDNGVSGFGVWTSTTSCIVTGQLSCTLNIPEAASATVALFNVRTTFYVLFATRNK